MALLDGMNLGIGGGQQSRDYNEDRRVFNKGRWLDGNVDLTGNGFELIGEYQVGARQEVEFGQGTNRLHPMEQGRPYMDLQDGNSSAISGTVRFLHVSAQDGRTIKIRDIDTETLRESTKSERDVFERSRSRGKEAAARDSFLRIKLNADDTGNGTLSKSKSTYKVPVTVREYLSA